MHLALKPEPVDVWLVDLLRPRDLLLDEIEQQRAARFRFEEDRVRWSRARSALRRVLAHYTYVPPLALQFDTGPHGKPFLKRGDWEFNLSHSGDWAIIGITRGVPVGIDIEQVRETVRMRDLLRRIREPAPDVSTEELFRVWSRREARTKAVGSELMEVPGDHVVACDVTAANGYVAAVALCGAVPEALERGEL